MIPQTVQSVSKSNVHDRHNCDSSIVPALNEGRIGQMNPVESAKDESVKALDNHAAELEEDDEVAEESAVDDEASANWT
jgi:hypothetical protein